MEFELNETGDLLDLTEPADIVPAAWKPGAVYLLLDTAELKSAYKAAKRAKRNTERGQFTGVNFETTLDAMVCRLLEWSDDSDNLVAWAAEFAGAAARIAAEAAARAK